MHREGEHPGFPIPQWDVVGFAPLAPRQRLMQTVADNIRAYMAGSPINVVN